jgi:hypothetical protein
VCLYIIKYLDDNLIEDYGTTLSLKTSMDVVLYSRIHTHTHTQFFEGSRGIWLIFISLDTYILFL